MQTQNIYKAILHPSRSVMKRTSRGIVCLISIIAFLASVAHGKAQALVDWTFETSKPTTGSTGSFSPEVNNTGSSALASLSGSSVAATTVGNGSAAAFNTSGWSTGGYFQFTVNTTGYQNIGVSFDQTGSNGGPRDFAISYGTDGTTFTQAATYTLTNDAWTSATYKPVSTRTYDLSAVPALNNGNTVYFRLIDLDTTSISGGTVASGGTDRVDNFTVSQVPEPATCLGGILLVGALGWNQRRLLAGLAGSLRNARAA